MFFSCLTSIYPLFHWEDWKSGIKDLGIYGIMDIWNNGYLEKWIFGKLENGKMGKKCDSAVANIKQIN